MARRSKLGKKATADVSSLSSQMAQKATKDEVRLKAVKLEQTDLSETLLQQMAGTTPINAVPADGIVTPKKTTFIDIIPGTNIYNPAEQTVVTIADNSVLTNGVISGGFNNNFVTAPIYVKPSTTYTISHEIWWDNGVNTRGAMFKADGTFIQNITTSAFDGDYTDPTTFTTTSDTAYIRLVSQKSAMFTLTWVNTNFMIVEGSTLPQSYIAYVAPTYKLNETIQLNKPLFVTVSNDVVNVISKYNATQDLLVTLKKRGGNNLIDFHTWSLIPNTSSFVSSSIGSASLLYTNSTDFIEPYLVRAINNIDGDLPASTHFTGGMHEYTNTGSGGTPTARTLSYAIRVDGRQVGSIFSGYANFIDIKWKNRVQATNTKNTGGTGREVLEETIHLHFDGDKWTIGTQITALEDIKIERYYGVALKNMWGNDIIYKGDTIGKQVLNPIDSFSTGTKCTTIVNSGATHSAEMGIEPYGLSSMVLNKLGASGMTSTVGKSYMVLIYNNTTDNLTAGNMYHFRGYFKFYPTF